MPEIASDIVVSGARLFHSAVGTALPDDTVTVNDPWPVGWTYVGYTLEALKLTYSFEVLDIEVQQTMASIARTRQKEEASLETVLAEFTGANLAQALAGANVQTAAGSGIAGKETISIGGDYVLPERQWGIQGSYKDASGVLRPIRVFLWRATVSEGGDLTWDRTAPAGIPLKIRALADTSKPVGQHLIRIVRYTDDPL